MFEPMFMSGFEWALTLVIFLKIYGPMIAQVLGAAGIVLTAYYLTLRGIL